VLNLITPSYAQETAPAPHSPDAPPTTGAAVAEAAHGAEQHAFPPFDPSTFGSQLFWLVVTFGALYLLMSRVALPRIGGILESRSGRIAGDLAEAGRLKENADAASAAYEQALSQARQNAHGIGQVARDAAKAEVDADRKRLEADLQGKLGAAETRIGEVKARALAEVDAIARDAAEAIVDTLIGAAEGQSIAPAEIARAVEAVQAGRGDTTR